MQLTRDLFAIAKFLFSYVPTISMKNAFIDPMTLTFDLSTSKTMSLLGYSSVIPYTEFEHLGVIPF